MTSNMSVTQNKGIKNALKRFNRALLFIEQTGATTDSYSPFADYRAKQRFKDTLNDNGLHFENT